MNQDEIAAQLEEFANDPKRAMNEPLVKTDVQAPGGRGIHSLFPAESLHGAAFVDQRDRYRKRLSMLSNGVLIRLDQIQPGRAPFATNDMVENLVDNTNGVVRRLEEIESHSLRQAKLAESPWSDWYWPIYQGILGCRYTDPSFPIDSEDWKEKRQYVLAHPVAAIVASGKQEAINRLSPSEKYDLLIGDAHGSLTSAMWREGESYYDQNGKVERWMGICHGWSPASYMLPRPTRALQVVAADGKTKLLFYPADLKALGSLLWAKGSASTRFIGGRCNDKTPAMDENGRVKSQACFDDNPGTWHLAVVNQIGVSKRSMIIDATFDYEVWNQPVLSYSYSYFNPRTGKPVASLAQAREAISAVAKDKFHAYRSKDARALVGVAMNLTYVAETMPTSSATDSPAGDYAREVSYLYDLELAEDGRIIGGEWYNNKHPDFLWTPPAGTVAKATTDYAATGTWDDDTLPESWSKAALAAARNGQPLGKIVTTLIQMSRSLGG